MSEDFLERVWAFREENIYPEFFGETGPGIYTISLDTFKTVFQMEPDPRWSFTGVFECPPGPKHSDWIYVTSGLSNPWEQDEPAETPDQPSWLGVELIFRSTEKGTWAILMVQRIAAFEILLGHSRYPGRERLNFGDRIPLRGPIIPDTESVLTHILVAPPPDGPESFYLESGVVDFIQLVGISEAEAAFGRENGSDALLQLLTDHNAYATTDPQRKSLV